jgi:putative ABC transport system permease protein
LKIADRQGGVVFGYNFTVALQNILRQTPLSALIVCTLGLGVGAAVTMQTVLHVMSGDPIPHRSATLFHPKLNPLPKSYTFSEKPSAAPDNNFTWQDATALVETSPAKHRAAMAGGEVVVTEPTGGSRYVYARYATADFFPMFDLPLLAGRGWSTAEDHNGSAVVVVAEPLAERLFPNGDAIGKRITINERIFSVIGIIPEWRAWPKFYADLSTAAFTDPDQVFMPLRTAMDTSMPVSGAVTSWGKEEVGSGLFKSTTATWLQVWVQLPRPEDVKRYREFLANFAADRHNRGVYERGPETAELVGLIEWLDRQALIPENVKIQLWLAYAFLFVCAINVSALLLSKFMSGGNELAIRRALGAKKRAITQQLTIEGALLGLAGGTMAIIVSQIGLWVIRRQPDDYSKLAHMDSSMMVLALGIGVATGLLAALWPAWRISSSTSINHLI